MWWFNKAKRFLKAIEKGDARKAKSLIASGLDANSVVQGQTLAYWAVRYERGGVLSALIAAGADIGKRTDTGSTPLSAAISDNSTKIVRILMEAGAFDREPNAETELLIDAIIHESADEVFDMLFAAGVDANARDSGGTPALIYALYKQLSHAAKLLVEHGASVSTAHDGATPLGLAAKAGFGDVVDALLKAGAKVNQQDESGATPLDYAEIEGHAGVAKVLREAGALGCAEIKEKAREAAAKGDIDGAMAVIHEGGDLQRALFMACTNGQADMIKPLVNAGADVHEEYCGECSLSQAANAATVRALIEVGADVNRPNEDGRSPLFHAAGSASPEVIKALLDAGATVAGSSPYSRTPLHVAAMHGRHEVVRLLTEAGADVTSQGGRGTTPLMEAAHYAREGGTETIRALLGAGAPMEEVDFKGQTALMHAVTGSNEVTLKALLAQGARVDVKNREGKTPYDLLDKIPVPSDADEDEFAAIMQHRDRIREVLDRARHTSN